MSEDNSVQLVGSRKRKKVNLEKCIICQQEKRSEKLTSTENGRSKFKLHLAYCKMICYQTWMVKTLY